jgi:signal transduction histidine kinase
MNLHRKAPLLTPLVVAASAVGSVVSPPRGRRRVLLRQDGAAAPDIGATPVAVQNGYVATAEGRLRQAAARSRHRWERSRLAGRPAADVVLAVAVAVATWASFVDRFAQMVDTEDGPAGFAQPDALGAALILIGATAIIWRRRRPWAVLLVTSLSFVGYLELGYAPPPIPYGPLVALYTLVAVVPAAGSLAATAVLAVGVVLVSFTTSSAATDDQFLAYLISLGAGWSLGYGVQQSRARTALAEAHAAALVHDHDTRTRLALEQERARIARELHDIVSHHVSVIVAQATAVQRVARLDPQAGTAALSSIETIGREAMVQMRRLLGVLQPGPTDPTADTQPGMAGLAELLTRTENAGLPVDLVVRGALRSLPPAVDRNAYRIVQEALTNVLKHAGATRAQVDVGHEPGLLRLRIRDDGHGTLGRPTAGHGLTGILARVTLLGGRLAVGPLADGGFEVAADLPLNGAGA